MARSNSTYAEYLKYRCPYTDKICHIWNCSECEQEKKEREWMKESEGESRIITDDTETKWKKRIEAIIADITRYWLDCDFAVNDKHCKQCGENVFGSILRIIDKHTKGEPDGHN